MAKYAGTPRVAVADRPALSPALSRRGGGGSGPAADAVRNSADQKALPPAPYAKFKGSTQPEGRSRFWEYITVGGKSTVFFV